MVNENFLVKHKKKILIAVTVLCVAFVSAVAVSSLLQKRTISLVYDDCRNTVGQEVEQYVKEFQVVNDGESFILGEETSRVIATTVTSTMDTYLTGTNVTTVSTLTKNVEDSVNSQVASLNLPLSKEDQEILTSGITSLVISSVYKAISDRGLISVADLTYMRTGLEDRILGLERILSGQSNEVSVRIHELKDLVDSAEIASSEQIYSMEQLRADLDALEKQLAILKDYDETVVTKEELQKTLEKTVEKILVDMENSEFLETQLTQLKTKLSALDTKLVSLDSLTKAEISSLQTTLTTTKTGLEKKIEEEASKIQALEEELLRLTTDFTSQLLVLQSTQTNLEKTVNLLSQNVGEGSVDERITQLCNELALALGADLSSTNSLLSGQIDALNKDLQKTEGNLHQELNSLEGSILTLNEEQTQALNAAKDALNSSMLSNKNELNETIQNAATQLNELISGNATDISALHTSLNDAKADLERQMEEADEEQKKVLQENITALETAQTLINDELMAQMSATQTDLNSTKTALEEAKTNLIGSLTGLQNNLSSANSSINILESSLRSLESDLSSQLNTKANKDEVTNALNNKADDTDVNALMDRISSLEEDLNNMVTYTVTDGKPTITINIP